MRKFYARGKGYIVLPILFLAMILSSLAYADITTGLLSHWTFEDGSGEGKEGSASLLLQGTSEYKDIPDIIQSHSQITVSAWVKPAESASGRTMYILDQQGAGNDPIYISWAEGSGSNDFKFRCEIQNNQPIAARVISSSQYQNTSWHFIACTYDGSQVKLYVDGAAPVSSPLTGNISNTSGSNLLVGSDTLLSNWNGLIDDLRIYDRALSAEELGQLSGISAVPAPKPAPPTPQGNYYVDGVSGSDTNPGTEALPFKTIQRAADLVNPGEAVWIKGGLYKHRIEDCPSATCYFVNITRSGTKDNPIVFKAHGKDSIILEGLGFKDADDNFDGEADGPNFPKKSEILIRLDANYVHLSDFELRNSGGSAMTIEQSFNVVENMKVHDNWFGGIGIGGRNPGRIEGNVINYVEAYRNRHGGGIGMARPADTTGLLTKNIVQNSISYANGYLPDGTKVLPINGDPAGGGNSDGMGVAKNCNDLLTEEVRKATGIENYCPYNVFRGNIVWSNADDGFDTSFADSLFVDNISFGNGPEGNKGYKQLRDVKRVAFVGNIAYANLSVGFELRTAEGGVFINNLAIDNGSQGVLGVAANAYVANNIFIFNRMNDMPLSLSCAGCSNNWRSDSGAPLKGDPLLVNKGLFKDANGKIVVDLPAHLTIAQKVDWIRSQFKAAFSLQSSSPAIDKGITVSYTDPITGEDLTREVIDSAPDLGVYEYNPGKILYVDSSLPGGCSNYSTASRTCSGGSEQAYKTIQEAADVVNPSDTVYIRGGTYQHSQPINLNTSNFITISRSGTTVQPIRFEGFGSERPVISGWGFEDRDLNKDGLADGIPGGGGNREKLFIVTGDYIQIRNLELTNSSGSGLIVKGSYGLFENIISHDNWFSNFSIYAEGKVVEENVFQYLESYQSRHDGGLVLSTSATQPAAVSNNIIQNSISYRNGFESSVQKVLPTNGDPTGGGNSDGAVVGKQCADNSLGKNICTGNIFRGLITFGNADDGIDVSFSGGSKVEDSISFKNGPEGNQGFKGFSYVDDISYIGNVSVDNMGDGFQPRINGRGAFHHNIALRNSDYGMKLAIQPNSSVKAYNNVTLLNGTRGAIKAPDTFSDSSAILDARMNWDSRSKGNAGLTNSSFTINTEFPSGYDIQGRVEFIRMQFKNALQPVDGSSLIDKGTLIPGLHCDSADNDPVSPMDPKTSCRHWNGLAPDMGAYEYGPSNQPPKDVQGDVSGNNKVTMYDAALVLKYTLGSDLSNGQKNAADVNKDGKIDGTDVVAIARKALGL